MELLKLSYLTASRLARRLPPRARHAVADLGGLAWYTLSRGQAANARRNYAAVLGLAADHPDVGRAARRAFMNYGRMLEDFVLIGTARREEVLARLTYHGREHVDAALSRGRGCILALPHSGSWDVAGCVAAILGYPIVAVAQQFPGSLDRTVVAGREAFGLRVIPLGRPALRRLEAALAQNSLAALLCDINHGQGGVEVTFFGQPAKVPAGPAAISLRTGAPIVPVGIRLLPDGSYEALVDPPITPTPTGDKAADIRSTMQLVADAFEAFIRANPTSWYAFKPLLKAAGAPRHDLPPAARAAPGPPRDTESSGP